MGLLDDWPRRVRLIRLTAPHCRGWVHGLPFQQVRADYEQSQVTRTTPRFQDLLRRLAEAGVAGYSLAYAGGRRARSRYVCARGGGIAPVQDRHTQRGTVALTMVEAGSACEVARPPGHRWSPPR